MSLVMFDDVYFLKAIHLNSRKLSIRTEVYQKPRCFLFLAIFLFLNHSRLHATILFQMYHHVDTHQFQWRDDVMSVD